jgi:hypothetical protein
VLVSVVVVVVEDALVVRLAADKGLGFSLAWGLAWG